MSTEIDNRIVEMRFDNKQFEDGVKQTTSTLDKLKESLKFDGAKSGFEDIEKAANDVKLSGIGQSVEELSNKFSALGIVGMTVMQNLTNRVVDFGINMVKGMSVDQIREGWNKYEQSLTSFQTIFNNARNDEHELISEMENGTEYVKEQLDELAWFADETSYSYTDMVNNIGRFTSSGVGLETAKKSMIGIANAAGLAGAGVESASHAMSGFSKAIAKGKMDQMSWSWIQTAKMDTEKLINALIEAGEEVGNLSKGEITKESFLGSLKDGWADVEVMNKALAKFGDATEQIYAYQMEHGLDTASQAIAELGDQLDATGLQAFKASQEAKTFTDVINSVKDAVSSGWMKTFELIFGDYKESVEMWTALANNLWDVFAGPGSTRNQILGFWREFEGRENLLRGLSNIGSVLLKIIMDVREVFADVFGWSIEDEDGNPLGLKSVGKTLADLTESFADATDVFAIAFGVVGDEAEEAADSVEELTDKTEQVKETAEAVGELAKQVIQGIFGNGEARKKALEEQGHSYEAVQNKVNELLGCTYRYRDAEGNVITETEKLNDKLEELSEVSDDSAETFEELEENMRPIPNLGEMLTDTIRGIADAIEIVYEVGKGIIGDVVMPIVSWAIPRLVTGFLTITSTIGRFTSKIAETIRESEAITTFFANVHNAIDMVLQSIDDAFYAVQDLPAFKELQTYVENFITFVQNGINQVVAFISEHLGKLNIDGAAIFGNVLAALDIFISSVNRLISYVSPYVTRFFSDLTPYLGMIRDGLLAILGVIVDIASHIDLKVILYVIGAIFVALYDLFNLVKEFIQRSKIKVVFAGLRAQIGKYKSIIKGLAEEVKASTNIVDGFRESFKNFGGILSDATGKVKGFAAPLTETIIPAFDKLKKKFDELTAPIVKFVKGITLDNLLEYGKKLSIILLALSGAGLITNIGKIAKSISYIPDAISGVLNAFKGKVKAKIVIEYAIAIGILAGSLYLLAKTPAEQLKAAAIALAIAVGALAGLIVVITAMNKLTNNAELLADAGLMIGFAAVITSVIYAMLALKELTGGEFWSSIGRVLVVLGVVLAAMFLLNQINAAGKWVGANKAIGNMVALWLFSMSIKKIVDALIEIAEYDLLKLQSSMLVLVECMVILGAVAWAAGHLTFGGGIGMLAIVGSIWLLVQVLEKMEDVDFQKISTTVSKMRDIFIMLGVIALIARVAGNGALGVAAIILTMTSFLKSFADICKTLEGVDENALGRISGIMMTLIVVVGMFVAVSALVKVTNMLAVVGILAALTITMYALSVLISVIALIGPDDFEHITYVVESLIFVMTLFIGAAGFASKAAPTILALTLMVAAIAGIMWLMQDIKNLDQVAKAMDMIMQVILGLTVIAGILSGLQAIFGLSLALVKIGVGLGAGLAAIGAGIGVGLAAIGAGIAVGAGLVAIVGQFLIPLANALTDAATKISDAVKVVEGIDAEKVKTNFGAIAEGFKSFASTLGGDGGFHWYSGFQAEGMVKIAEAINAMKDIFPVLSNANFGVSMVNLTTLATTLKSFANKIASFDISDLEIERFRNFSIALGNMPGPLMELQKINNVEKIGTILTTIGGSLASFSEALTTDAVERTFDPNSGAAIATIFGSLDEMADGVTKLKDVPAETIKSVLKSIGESLTTFAEVLVSNEFSTVYYNTDKAQGITALVSNLGTLADGVKKIADIGVDKAVAVLGALGPAFVEFGKALQSSGLWDVLGTGMKADGIESLISTIASLGDQVVSFIQTTEPYIQQIEGTNSTRLDEALTDISGAFQRFATSLKSNSIADAIGSNGKASGINLLITSITTLADGVKHFVDELGGDKAAQAETAMTTIGGGFKAMGEALNEAGWFAEGKGKGIKEAMTGVNYLTTALKKVVEIGDDKVEKSTTTVSNALDTLRTSIFSFSGPNGIEGGNFATVIQSILDLMRELNGFDLKEVSKLGSRVAGSIHTALEEAQYDLLGKFSQIISLMGDLIDAYAPNYRHHANGLMQQFILGVTEYEDTVTSAAKTVLRNVLSSLESVRSEFRNLGVNLSNGIAEGIGDSKAVDNIAKAARRVVRIAKDNAADEAGVNSPSKLFMHEVGEPISEGMAMGIENNAFMAAQAARETVISTMASAADALANSDFDDQNALQIKPVLSLDDARSTVGDISDMVARTNAEIAASSIEIDSRIDQMGELVAITNKIYKAVNDGTFGNTINVSITNTDGLSVSEISDAVIDQFQMKLASENSRWAY